MSVVQQRRARDREEVRRALLDAARELLEGEGYAAVTMRRVAERAEYGLGTVYSYFSDKDDLLYAIARADFARTTEQMRAIRDTETGVAAVRGMLLTYVRFGLDQPRTYQVMFMLRPRLATRNVEDTTDEHAYTMFRNCVARCIENGEFRAADPDALAQLLWASVHGLVSLRVTLPDFPWHDPELLAGTLIDAELRGLAPD